VIWKESSVPVRWGAVIVNRPSSNCLVIAMAAGEEQDIGVIGGRSRGL
jgi:hypothetical protein